MSVYVGKDNVYLYFSTASLANNAGLRGYVEAARRVAQAR